MLMDAERLAAHLRDRPASLRKAKEEGLKIIGYFPGGYVPEEIIYASGAIPVCLADGGDSRPADTALSVVPRIVCPFARAQIGERLLKVNPYYNMIDMLIAPITCQHLRKVAEVWEYYGEMEVFKLGVPHNFDGDFELEYYEDRLRALKDRLETFTGNQITDDRIRGAIELYNRMRESLKTISLMRRSSSPPLSALDFVKLNHGSFYADPVFMVDVLGSLQEELEKGTQIDRADKVRLLLVGPNLAHGDYTILELVDAAGGEIVVEELSEGIRYYWGQIENSGDPFHSLANGYFRDRLPCAFMRRSVRRRLDFIFNLIDDFNVSGVIWYELLCCETYDQESYVLAEKMQELHIPILIVESDYDVSKGSSGSLKTRIDALIEIVKGGQDND
jgi:benzoyl-CoA reductase/2-hydroxyglutaryl-CoA dehydratase subunit BcrC/BadD/HgdB